MRHIVLALLLAAVAVAAVLKDPTGAWDPSNPSPFRPVSQLDGPAQSPGELCNTECLFLPDALPCIQLQGNSVWDRDNPEDNGFNYTSYQHGFTRRSMPGAQPADPNGSKFSDLISVCFGTRQSNGNVYHARMIKNYASDPKGRCRTYSGCQFAVNNVKITQIKDADWDLFASDKCYMREAIRWRGQRGPDPYLNFLPLVFASLNPRKQSIANWQTTDPFASIFTSKYAPWYLVNLQHPFGGVFREDCGSTTVGCHTYRTPDPFDYRAAPLFCEKSGNAFLDALLSTCWVPTFKSFDTCTVNCRDFLKWWPIQNDRCSAADTLVPPWTAPTTVGGSACDKRALPTNPVPNNNGASNERIDGFTETFGDDSGGSPFAHGDTFIEYNFGDTAICNGAIAPEGINCNRWDNAAVAAFVTMDTHTTQSGGSFAWSDGLLTAVPIPVTFQVLGAGPGGKLTYGGLSDVARGYTAGRDITDYVPTSLFVVGVNATTVTGIPLLTPQRLYSDTTLMFQPWSEYYWHSDDPFAPSAFPFYPPLFTEGQGYTYRPSRKCFMGWSTPAVDAVPGREMQAARTWCDAPNDLSSNTPACAGVDHSIRGCAGYGYCPRGPNGLTCSGRGACKNNGRCFCDAATDGSSQWGGRACEFAVPVRPYNCSQFDPCSETGYCIETTLPNNRTQATCVCHPGWRGNEYDLNIRIAYTHAFFPVTTNDSTCNPLNTSHPVGAKVANYHRDHQCLFWMGDGSPGSLGGYLGVGAIEDGNLASHDTGFSPIYYDGGPDGGQYDRHIVSVQGGTHGLANLYLKDGDTLLQTVPRGFVCRDGRVVAPVVFPHILQRTDGILYGGPGCLPCPLYRTPSGMQSCALGSSMCVSDNSTAFSPVRVCVCFDNWTHRNQSAPICDIAVCPWGNTGRPCGEDVGQGVCLPDTPDANDGVDAQGSCKCKEGFQPPYCDTRVEKCPADPANNNMICGGMSSSNARPVDNACSSTGTNITCGRNRALRCDLVTGCVCASGWETSGSGQPCNWVTCPLDPANGLECSGLSVFGTTTSVCDHSSGVCQCPLARNPVDRDYQSGISRYGSACEKDYRTSGVCLDPEHGSYCSGNSGGCLALGADPAAPPVCQCDSFGSATGTWCQTSKCGGGYPNAYTLNTACVASFATNPRESASPTAKTARTPTLRSTRAR
jgi:hypothetical protein